MSKPAPATLVPLILGGKFKRLFVEHLGWEQSPGGTLPMTLPETAYNLKPVAEKKGVKVWALETVPDKAARNQIEKAAVKSDFEHLIIYHSPDFKEQIWQWPKRLGGRRTLRELRLGQGAHDLSQRLAQISIDLDKEAELTLSEVNQRLGRAFDVERVTRRFFAAFQQELKDFSEFIKGLENEASRDWYASLTLNRLMFIYFIQKKGFLNDDPDYLRHKLAEVRAAGHAGEFQTFYRLFLRRLFHEGLGSVDIYFNHIQVQTK